MVSVSQRQQSEQARASQAWRCIQSVESQIPNDKEKYGSLARQLPSLIQTNGLGQTLAFICSKGKGLNNVNHHNLIYIHISEWVIQQLQGRENLLEWIITEDSDTYRRATTEALSFALWLRRFAEAQGWGEQDKGRDA
jgi:CRISPR-associated protein Cmr5